MGLKDGGRSALPSRPAPDCVSAPPPPCQVALQGGRAPRLAVLGATNVFFFLPVLFKSSVEVLRGKTDWRSQHGAVTYAIDVIDWHGRHGSGELLAH